ncbi:MAG: hypothetical protein MK289_23280 [Trichodesmium sp. ALOHA_ZT_67]|nr:hypothetical protein [Trichodesmium sp. ALOHA_ZT_67]
MTSLCEARVGSVYVAIAKSQNKIYIFLFWHKFNTVGKLFYYVRIISVQKKNIVFSWVIHLLYRVLIYRIIALLLSLIIIIQPDIMLLFYQS